MRKMTLVMGLAFVVASLSGCAAMTNWVTNNAATVDTAATIGGESSVYIFLTAQTFSNPAGVQAEATDIVNVATSLKSLVNGSVPTATIELTFQDFGVGLALVPEQYQFLATAIQAALALIPGSINIPTADIPPAYLTAIGDFCTSASAAAQKFIPATAALKASPPNPTLSPLNNFVNSKTGGT